VSAETVLIPHTVHANPKGPALKRPTEVVTSHLQKAEQVRTRLHGTECPIPLSLSVQLTPPTTTAPRVVLVQLSPSAHFVLLRGMRRRQMQPLRVCRGQWLLLPELSVRGPHGERARREEQVRCGIEHLGADPVVERVVDALGTVFCAPFAGTRSQSYPRIHLRRAMDTLRR
jgi:hypothetical protein